MKHNNQLPNGHFHKDWQLRVKTWFNQPGRKKRRRINRIQKAARIAPRPIELLRPAVRCPTIKYNTKLRAGRGFTLDELKAAGIRRKEALTIGIPVDHRRKNRSEESLQLNVERLKTYKDRLIVLPRKPRKSRKPKEGDDYEKKKNEYENKKAEFATASQHKGHVIPIQQTLLTEEARIITEEERAASAYVTLRKARSDARLVGVREARRKAKEEEEATKKK
ncbi:50S ribosomal protein L13e [Gigaspora margarita]|uniref:60S ribosomal protein L13 n=1 Tax=Gigaspora margarita TaxID=4874 RepID=A0A8H3XF26_GIGMA|nr:50S ribosomal protein L13e [Gigaspora margarita]